MSASARALTLIFTKRPVAGGVKTRLCPPLTPEEAAALALAMLDDTLERHLAARAYRTELTVAPATDTGWFRDRYAGVRVTSQVGDGLGQRLAHGFELRCAPDRTVVALGSDCPSLGADAVIEAHARLAAGVDLVLAPDGGGGYSLVGLARPAGALFTRVPMSTRTMFDDTLRLARSMGLSVELLDEYGDVDEPEDLARLDRELRGLARDLTMGARAADPGFPSRTFEWLRRHAERR